MEFNGECEGKSDAELVQLSLEEADWYGCLMKRYEAKLGRYIFRISGLNQEDIEDLLQEVFLTVYKNLNDFNPKLKFSSWIYRITHNIVISHHRKAQARAQLIGGEESEKFIERIQDDKDTEEVINDKITGEVFESLFDKLSPKYKEVLILRYLEEKEYNEISDILKKPLGTVATLLSRAKKQMRELIEQEGIQL